MKKHPIITEMLEEVKAFCKQHKMTKTQFGVMAVRDGNIVRSMDAGIREPRLSTLERMRVFMETYGKAKR